MEYVWAYYSGVPDYRLDRAVTCKSVLAYIVQLDLHSVSDSVGYLLVNVRGPVDHCGWLIMDGDPL